MFTNHIYTATLLGVNAELVRVETSISSGLSQCSLVGLAETEIKESRERVRAALKSCGLPFPRGRVTVSLAPAVVKKQGAHFDVPIAISMLVAQGIVPEQKAMFFGELSLNGEVMPVCGILAYVLCARANNIRTIYLPKTNLAEASLVDDVDLYPIPSLGALVDHLQQQKPIETQREKRTDGSARESNIDFAVVRGQESVKRAMEIAAGGGHNILLNGTPGSGKTMLARSLPTILPSLSQEEILEVTNIHSIAGELSSKQPYLTERPFRSPHHSSSAVSIIGGGSWPRPGEVSLAHRGVLFLDEFPEFPRHVLEHLRQPLEDGEVTIARALGTFRFPAHFMLVAAMNPCPCGYATDPVRECVCGEYQIAKYKKRISGPLLDRIDLCVTVPRVETDKLTREEPAESSEAVRQRVEAARERQYDRYAKQGWLTNSEIPPRHLTKCIPLGEAEKKLIASAIDKYRLSARSYTRLLKTSRTIADLADDEHVTITHISEALHFRPLIDG